MSTRKAQILFKVLLVLISALYLVFGEYGIAVLAAWTAYGVYRFLFN